MNLLSQGMTASTEISILRNNSSIEKSSQSIARFKKKKQTIEQYHFEQTEQRCIYTCKENEKDNTGDLFVERAVVFSVLYVFQVFKIE